MSDSLVDAATKTFFTFTLHYSRADHRKFRNDINVTFYLSNTTIASITQHLLITY